MGSGDRQRPHPDPEVTRMIRPAPIAGSVRIIKAVFTGGIMRKLASTILLATITATTAAAQHAAPMAAAPSYGGPVAGDVAPDFTLPGATRYGTLATPVRLSDFRGQTVVLAFFPGARTAGCTMQMTRYRDLYPRLFRDGAGIVVLGVSMDADTTLANWAREAHFPMLFASDRDTQAAGTAYGAYDSTYKLDRRLLYVIGPDGRITYVAKPFNPARNDSYAALARALGTSTE